MNLESFNSWLASVPEEIKRDSLWKMEAYQIDGNSMFQGETFNLPDLQTLLQHIPYPDD